MGQYSPPVGLLRQSAAWMNHGITAGGLDNAAGLRWPRDFIERYIFPGGEPDVEPGAGRAGAPAWKCWTETCARIRAHAVGLVGRAGGQVCSWRGAFPPAGRSRAKIAVVPTACTWSAAPRPSSMAG